MLATRDIVWGLLLGVIGMLLVQSVPLMRAEAHVDAQVREAFIHVYRGSQTLDGAVIKPEDSQVHVDPNAPRIRFRRLTKLAEHVSWNGTEVELVYRHMLGVGDADSTQNLEQEVHLRLSKVDGELHYTHFHARGQNPLSTPIADNPWIELLAAAKDTYERDQ